MVFFFLRDMVKLQQVEDLWPVVICLTCDMVICVVMLLCVIIIHWNPPTNAYSFKGSMARYIDACVLLDNPAVNVIHLNKEGKIHILMSSTSPKSLLASRYNMLFDCFYNVFSKLSVKGAVKSWPLWKLSPSHPYYCRLGDLLCLFCVYRFVCALLSTYVCI